jgi:hypothetical protein
MDFMRTFGRKILFSASMFSLTPLSLTPAPGQEPGLTATPAGAGFVIGTKGEILTNAHVVEGCDSFQARARGRTVKAFVLAQDAVNDLAILRLDGPAPGGAPSIRTTPPLRGEQIVTLGFLPSGEAHPGVGAVNALMAANDIRMLDISVPIPPESSGGPLLDLGGHVIGAVSSKPDAAGAPSAPADGTRKSGFAIKASVVGVFLDAYGISYRTTPPSPWLEAADIAEEAEDYTYSIACLKAAPVAAAPSRTPGQTSFRLDPRDVGPSSGTPRAALVLEDPWSPAGDRFDGTVAWRVERVNAADGGTPDVVLHADIEIPHKVSVRWSLERNYDKQIPANYFIKIAFTLPTWSTHGGVAGVPGVLMKDGETADGLALIGSTVKISENFFLIALFDVPTRTRNFDQFWQRSWLEVPANLGDGRRFRITFEKGSAGKRAFDDAFAVWGAATNAYLKGGGPGGGRPPW